MRALGWLLGTGSALAAVLLLFPAVTTWWTPLALAASFLTYLAALPVLWLLTLVPGLAGPGRRTASLAGMVVAAALTVTLGLPLIERFGVFPSPGRDDLRVVSLNVEFGEADVGQLMGQVQRNSADVVVLMELTPDYVARLQAAGFMSLYPHWIGEADEDASGTGVFSRTPIAEVGRAASIFTGVAGRTEVRGTSWTVAGVHPVSPFFTAATWDQDAAAVRELLVPLRSANTVVVGDFNAVSQHYTMKRLYDLGYVNAVHQTGAGWQPTWPMEKGYPAIIDIDHALTSPQVAATGLRFFEVPGTDHRGLEVSAAPAG